MAGTLLKRDIEEFEWKIENFSLSEGTYFCPKVSFQSETWQFAVFQNPIDEYINLAIMRSASGPPIAVKFYFGLKISDGQKSHQRGETEFYDQWKYGVSYRMISVNEFERRKLEFLSTGCLSLIIRMKSAHFVEPAGRLHFFRSKYIPMNSSAPVSHENLPVSTTSDGVKNENASGELEWKIGNFSLTDDGHWSPEFKLESEAWKFVGISKSPDGYIDLGVLRVSSGSPILVEFSFALETSDGQKLFERVVSEIFHGWKYCCDYHWMKTSDFEDRLLEFLSSGCLTVIVTVKIVESVEAATSTSTQGSSVVCDHDKFLQDFKQLLLNHENSDVVLKVKGEEFPAHKAILAARSPVLASTFRNEMKEKKTGVVDIVDCDPIAFQNFLCFLYTNETDSLSDENVFALFKIADKYECLDLRATCLDFMQDNLSVETFCEALTISLQYGESELLRAVTNFFIKNATKILETVSWQTFVTENPIQSNELVIKLAASYESSSHG